MSPAGGSRRDLTYTGAGATSPAQAQWHPNLPGFRVHEHTERIGAGQECWAAASEAVMAWGVKTRSGFSVRPWPGAELGAGSGAGPGTEPGASAGQRVVSGADYWLHAHIGPFVVREPVRVVATTEDDARCGFAYGTLAGHPVSGEEAFIVHRADDGSVWLTLRSLTRPAPSAWRFLFPALLIAQRWYRRRYLRALR